MPAVMSRFVFDSFALIGYLEDETFSDRIEELLRLARAGDAKLYLHAIHMGEIYYITCREQGKAMADLVFSRIKSLPITYIDIIAEKLMLKAALFKANYPLSYADAFAAAMSHLYKSVLLTGDPEFKSLENENLIKVEWL